jgi:hypothetical protein
MNFSIFDRWCIIFICDLIYPAYVNYLTSPGGIIVDFTPPEAGPIGEAFLDMMKNDGCSATFNHAERCVDVTPQQVSDDMNEYIPYFLV